jgi:hypothetical protein
VFGRGRLGFFVLICEGLDEVDDVGRLVEGIVFEEGLDFFDVVVFFLSFFLFFFYLLEVGSDFVEAGGDVAVDAEDEALVAFVLFVEVFDFFEDEGAEGVVDLA